MTVAIQSGRELFRHGADIGVRGFGATIARAFEQAAVAMTSVMVDPDLVEVSESRSFTCSAPDLDMLLYDWLNALVYTMATERMLFREFRVSVQGTRLSAEALGERVNPRRHRPAIEIKGATFTELSVRKEGTTWIAQCVVDV